jgi:hypothetical protein
VPALLVGGQIGGAEHQPPVQSLHRLHTFLAPPSGSQTLDRLVDDVPDATDRNPTARPMNT